MKKTLRILLALALVALPLSALADQPVTVAANSTGSVQAVQLVTTSATKITSAFTQSRKNITIQNRGPDSIYCGFTAAQAASTVGYEVTSGSVLSMDLGLAIPVYCRATNANQVSPTDTRIIEVQ
jgi:hypothetical protein